MITIEKPEVFGWEAAVRGLRNPMNSWSKSDSNFSCKSCDGCYYRLKRNHEIQQFCKIEETDPEVCIMTDWCNHTGVRIGDNDLKLMRSLAKAGDDHAKFLRMINVTADITAPLYWWKEYDTYKVGTVANSCSTMHKLTAKEFEVDDFSHEWLIKIAYEHLQKTIKILNGYRSIYLETKEKEIWWQMIQLLPQSYNQKRTIDLNYQVLAHMYFARRNHKLSEWHEFCEWVEGLPYFKVIVIQEGEDGEKRLS